MSEKDYSQHKLGEGLLRLRGPRGFIVLIALAVLALISCTGGSEGAPEVVPEPTGTPIAFSAQQQEEKAVTRSTGLESVLTYFKVYGFKNTNSTLSEYQQVFPGYTVNWVENTAHTSETNSDGWEYVNQQPLGETEQTIKYWDWSAAAYRFFGVAGVTGTNEVTTAYKTYPTYPTYTAYELTYKADAYKEATIPYYSHLWYSDGSDPVVKPFGQPVQLEFIKPFSKVRFMFIFEDPSQAPTTTLTGKTFCPTNGSTIKMTGKVTVSYPITGPEAQAQEKFSATPESGGLPALTEDYYESVNTVTHMPYLDADGSVLSKIYTVLPATDQGTYTMTVKVNDDPKTAIVPAEFMNWLPGYQYTYIFKVHVDGSVVIDSVQSAFTQWVDNEKDHTIYNW